MGKKWWLLCIAVLLVLVLIGRSSSRTSEPLYNGKTLSAWIRRLPAQGSTSRGVSWSPLIQGHPTESNAEATEAVRRIGTNALPYLLAEIHTHKRSSKEELQDKWVQAKAFFRRMLSRPTTPAGIFNSSGSWEKTGAQRRHWDAARGFYALGPLANSAIPDLGKLLYQADSSPDAAYALSGMGPEGLMPLMQALTNNAPTNQWTQICVIWALGQTPTEGQKALPELLDLLKSPDGTLRMSAAWALGQIRSEPEIVMPALADNLGDTNINGKSMTEQALREQGIKEISIPALKEYLTNSTQYIRMAATNALKARYPEEAAKCGIE